MKKLVIILFFIIFVTGCDAEYNLTINKATIIEELEIFEKDNSKWHSSDNLFSKDYQEVIEDNLNYKLGIYFDEQLEDGLNNNPEYIFYKPKKIETKEKLGISYNYRFNVENYDRAYFPKSCFDNIKVYDDSGYITLSTSTGFNCMGDEYGLSSLTINITTKYHVEDSNADSINGRTYTWKINEENYEEEKIYIKIDTKKLSNVKTTSKDEEKILKVFSTIGITLAILLIIVIIILVKKKKQIENN